MSTLNLHLRRQRENNDDWTHIDDGFIFELDDLPAEMALCEVKIFNYFLFLEKDYYITLVNYSPGRTDAGTHIQRYENQYLNYKGSEYHLTSAVRIKIPRGYYKNPTELKQYLLYCVRYVVSIGGESLSEWYIGSDYSSPAIYYKKELFESQKEFSFNHINLNLFTNLINRLAYIKNNLSFIENSDSDHLFTLHVDQSLAEKLDFVSTKSIIPPSGSILT